MTANLATADQTLPANRTIQMNNKFLTFMDGQATKLQYNPNSDRFHFSGGLNVSGELNALATSGMSSGQVKFREPAMGGSSGVMSKRPAQT